MKPLCRLMQVLRVVSSWLGCSPEVDANHVTHTHNFLKDSNARVGWRWSICESRKTVELKNQELLRWIDTLPIAYPGIDDDVQDSLFAPLPVEVDVSASGPSSHVDTKSRRSSDPASSVGVTCPTDEEMVHADQFVPSVPCEAVHCGVERTPWRASLYSQIAADTSGFGNASWAHVACSPSMLSDHSKKSSGSMASWIIWGSHEEGCRTGSPLRAAYCIRQDWFLPCDPALRKTNVCGHT